MSEQVVSDTLSTKVTLLIEKFNQMKEENARLSTLLEENGQTIETLHAEVRKLKENDELKDMELEEITEKINNILA